VSLSLSETPAAEERAAAHAQRAAAASMKAFFSPSAVAVVGANRERGKIGAEILHNLLATGFAGRVIPVHPTAAAIGGLPAFPAVTRIPDPVELAVIAVPAGAVAAAVDDCVEKGVKALVVISAGFGETGPEGRARESVLLQKVRAAGVRMIGPNCIGVLNTDPAVRLNATFSPIFPPAGRVAMATQSGALGLAILSYAQRLNIGISTFASIGNKADVSSNDLIQYWADDPQTAVILLYLESFGNPRKFSQLARRIAREKPIVAVKAGRSAAGARAAASHTGSLASSDTVVDALFHQAGVIRTRTLEELFDVAGLLAHQPVPRGHGLAILTNAGGPGILAADAAEGHGLVLARLADATTAALRGFLPAAAAVGNPVDMLASASAEQYGRAIRLVLEDEAVDSVLVIFIPPLVTGPEPVARAIVEAAAEHRDKTVLATFMTPTGVQEILAPIPSYQFPESAVVALARATGYGAWLRRPEGRVATFDDLDRVAMRAIVDRSLSAGGGWIDPFDAQAILQAAGVRVAPARRATTEEDAVAAAAAIGFPVVLKAIAPGIVHKTEAGAVRLDLPDAEGVRTAYREMSRQVAGSVGWMVQRQVERGVEILIGATHDPLFGPIVACGTGGILVELFKDAVFRLHPLTDLDAAEMVGALRSQVLLKGYRGAPPADEAALRETLLRLSGLLEICPEIVEMDLNPVEVLVQGVSVVDVRIRVDRPPAAPPTRRVAY
jgi:acetyl coenzyme A synthetase (ADP forming)-like protein